MGSNRLTTPGLHSCCWPGAFNPDAFLPQFSKPSGKIAQGLTVYHSDQCPYTQNVPEIVMKVGEQLHIPVNIIPVDSARAAQRVTLFLRNTGIFL